MWRWEFILIEAELVNKLIDELKVNDLIPVSEYDSPPKEPNAIMKELIGLGDVVVERLIELLENRSKYSCLYAIKILGAIRDPRAVQPILNVLSGDEFYHNFDIDDETDGRAPIIALHKIGIPALEPTLEYLEKELKKKWEPNMYTALQILVGIKDEKSYSVLVEMLNYQSEEPEEPIVQPTAIQMLGEYGDKRAVEHLVKLLENDDTRNDAIGSIRKLVSTQEYRKIIAPYIPEYLDESRKKIEQSLRELKYAHYPSGFEGDDAEKINFIAQELSILSNLGDLFRFALAIAEYEGVFSDKEHLITRGITSKLGRRSFKLKEGNEEEKLIIDGYIPGPVLLKETRSYRGLASISDSNEQKLDSLRLETVNWLKKQNFHVLTKYNSLFYARKGSRNKRKGCYVYIGKDEKEQRRIWGLVKLVLWGEGWTTNQAQAFNESFWQHTFNIVTELVDKKKLQIETLKG